MRRALTRGLEVGWTRTTSPLQAEAFALQHLCIRRSSSSSEGKGGSDHQSALPAGLNLIEQNQLRHQQDPPGVRRLLDLYHTIPVERVRNFSVVAHIDHGKSTLSDKILEATGNIWPTEKGRQQVLDNLEVERQRGITVKAQSASMIYTDKETGLDYLLNLVDTPGHVDFAYEVSRSLAACQGALLLVDASQSVQAQTVANYSAAKEAGLHIIPVLTKIDLPTADPEPALLGLEGAFGFSPDSVLWTSAKSGEGIKELFPAIINRVPSPGSNAKRNMPLRCLLFDSWYDPFRGVVCLVQVVEGVLRAGDTIVAAHSGDKFQVQEVGLLAPQKLVIKPWSDKLPLPPPGLDGAATCIGGLGAGHVGYVVANMRSVKQARVGDTFYKQNAPVAPLPGFHRPTRMCFASLYPVDSGDFNALQTAVDRLTLNDSSVTVEKESSQSLGFGLRCGFLGLLHMDVFHSRLQSEFATPVIITAPMVAYRLRLHDGTERTVERPGDFPSPHLVDKYFEPTAHVSIMCPTDFVSAIMALLADKRGVQEDVIYLNNIKNSNNGGGSVDAVQAAAKAVLAAMPTQVADGGSSGDLPSSGASSAAAASPEDELEAAAAEAAKDDDADDEEEEEDDDEDEEDFDEEYEEKPSKRSHGHSSGGGGGGSKSSSAAAGSVRSNTLAALSSDRVVLKYRLPWSEVVAGLHDEVKSLTAGYASLDWLPGQYQEAPIVRVDILINGKPVDALSYVSHKEKAVSQGRKVAQKLKTVISRQQFEIVIQAAIGGKVFAKERIAPFRKDVLTKSGKTVGGGDKSRKQKLLQKQKEGKKRMKTVGSVQLSQEAFHSIMTKS
jgi:small GTP-binding protein